MSLWGALKDIRTRTLFVPEVLQTSMMDCGPATLKSVFDGHRRPINLERLRERCQTDVDGTSLSAMGETAERLGLDVSQVMVPKDNLLLPESGCLPAIVVLVTPDNLLHFVTVWNRIGSWVQVMDPARGRVWMPEKRFLEHVATPTLTLPEERWREWAAGEDFQGPLLKKLSHVGMSSAEAARIAAFANQDPSPRALAALDAATRMVRSLVENRAVDRGPAAVQLLERAFETDRLERSSIPLPYWTCKPGPRPDTVLATGALLIVVDGVLDEEEDEEEEEEAPADASESTIDQGPRGTAPLRGTSPPVRVTHSPKRTTNAVKRTRLTALGADMFLHGTMAARATKVGPENMSRLSVWAGPVVPQAVMAELRSHTVRPHRIFARLLWEDSRLAVILAAGLLVLGIGTGVLDALLMRGLSDLLGRMNLVAHRMVVVGAVVTFLFLALVVEMAQSHVTQRLARGLEARLRVAFLEKLPRLEDRYFRSRPVSDMASRAHLLQTLRGVPRFALDAGSAVCRLISTTAIVVWLEPSLWKLALGLLAVSLAMPLVSYRLLDEAMARMRILGGTLYRFYLDSLLGVVPVRVHGAERSVRREHEGILTEWVRASLQVESRSLTIKSFERLFGTLVAVAIVVTFVRNGGDLRGLLLVAFFAQRLPGDAEALIGIIRRYPLMKHDALRLFEPLAASEAESVTYHRPPTRQAAVGANIVFRGVTAVAGGQAVISNVNLTIPRGQHVAVVGPSGAGKSSLVGVLLGWLFVTEGRVLVDGRPLDAQRLVQLRDETAWVDPAVQIWNATLLENLLYGTGDEGLARIEQTLAAADLLDVVERLPDGLGSSLGEGGAKVSGGQGQRVRYGRALMKRDARLVILDEPFRGLERDKRRALLERARQLWAHATILFISHDVSDTLDMDRVLVIDGGELVEDGTPAELLAEETTFRGLVEGDREALEQVWGRPEWRTLFVDRGKVVQKRKAAS